MSLFDTYPTRLLDKIRGCTVCMRSDLPGIDMGPGDDLCVRCFERAAVVVERARAERLIPPFVRQERDAT